MKQSVAELQERRARLVALAEEQRQQIAYYFIEAQRPIRRAQRTLDYFAWMRKPWGMALIGLVVWKTPLRKLIKMPLWLWRGWKVTRAFKNHRLFV